jgi:plasmid stabilization system protein ParE
VRDWWELNRSDAPNALADDLQDMLARIAQNPTIGEVVESRRFRYVRRRIMRRTHYHVYFRSDGDDVEVVAFWHASRGSGPPL